MNILGYCVVVSYTTKAVQSPTYAGMNRWSIDTNLEINSMSFSPSNVGNVIRAEDLFNLAIFLSGLNNLIFPSSFLYAFIPSKHSKA